MLCTCGSGNNGINKHHHPRPHGPIEVESTRDDDVNSNWIRLGTGLSLSNTHVFELAHVCWLLAVPVLVVASSSAFRCDEFAEAVMNIVPDKSRFLGEVALGWKSEYAQGQ